MKVFSCATIEHMRLYLSVLACVIIYSIFFHETLNRCMCYTRELYSTKQDGYAHKFNIIVFGSDYPRNSHMMQYCIQHKCSDYFFNFIFLEYKPMSLLKLLHLMAIMSSTFKSSYCLSSDKYNWNIANNFNEKVISPYLAWMVKSESTQLLLSSGCKAPSQLVGQSKRLLVDYAGTTSYIGIIIEHFCIYLHYVPMTCWLLIKMMS